jgi:hypothetical protein
VLSLRDEDKRGFGQNVFPLSAFGFFLYIISFDLYERERRKKFSAQAAKLTYIKERL